MTIGGIQAFVSYITFMLWPIQDLARVFAEMQHAIASAERIFSMVDSTPEIADKPGAFDPGTIKGDIQFDNVNFWYEDGKPVLSDFNLHIKRGETIALVGPTGGGKTTTVNLLCRFYEPKSGSICIGGKDYREYSMHAIQSRIGVVLQTPHLFSGTIIDNLRYGRLNASRAEIEEAAKLAGAHEFIMSFWIKAMTSRWVKAAISSRWGRSSSSAWHAPSWPSPEIFIMDEATLGRYSDRGADPEGHGDADGELYQLRDRTPSLDHQAGAPHPGDRRWAHRRDGHACRTAAFAGQVLPTLHSPVPAPDGRGVRSIQGRGGWGDPGGGGRLRSKALPRIGTNRSRMARIRSRA
jgi:ABC-type branched-subunit amino acid transport system ATPase component